MDDLMRASTRSSPATLDDVAQRAGVSLATASRVLNGSNRRVAESYRVRVEAAAVQLGYAANVAAQATAKGTSAVIALLVADIADPYFGQIAAGVARGADEAGLVMTIGITQRDVERERGILRALRGQRPRGVILAASRATSHDSTALADELTALAGIGGRVVALGGGAGPVRSVRVDNRGGAYALGAALARGGYRESIVLAAAEGVVTSDERVAGFTDGFGHFGGRVRRLLRGAFTRESGAELMTAALEEGVPRGTVVFGVSDVVAIGAMSSARTAGRAVGADIAIAGFDDVPSAEDVSPSLTTVRVPLERVGLEALRAVLDDDWVPGRAELRLEVILRASTPLR